MKVGGCRGKALRLGLLGLCAAGSLVAGEALAAPARQAMVSRALRYLAASQRDDGTWDDTHGDQPGVAALALLAFLASGEDPADGPYAHAVRRCLHRIVTSDRPCRPESGCCCAPRRPTPAAPGAIPRAAWTRIRPSPQPA